MTDRCYWTVEGMKKYFIPGCMGAAVNGAKGCTCRDFKKNEKYEAMNAAVRLVDECPAGLDQDSWISIVTENLRFIQKRGKQVKEDSKIERKPLKLTKVATQ